MTGAARQLRNIVTTPISLPPSLPSPLTRDILLSPPSLEIYSELANIRDYLYQIVKSKVVTAHSEYQNEQFRENNLDGLHYLFLLLF